MIQIAQMKKVQSHSVTLRAGPRLTFLHITMTMVVAVMLTACGGDSATSNSGTSGTTPPPATVPTPQPVTTEVAKAVLTRGLPNFDVVMTQYVQSAFPTTVTRVEVKVTDATAVTALQVTLGTDFDTGVAATATQTAPGVWSISIPTTLPVNSGVQLALTLKNGDGFETGVTDFMVR